MLLTFKKMKTSWISKYRNMTTGIRKDSTTGMK